MYSFLFLSIFLVYFPNFFIFNLLFSPTFLLLFSIFPLLHSSWIRCSLTQFPYSFLIYFFLFLYFFYKATKIDQNQPAVQSASASIHTHFKTNWWKQRRFSSKIDVDQLMITPNRGGPPGFHQRHERHSQLQGPQHQTSTSSSPLEALLKQYI